MFHCNPWRQRYAYAQHVCADQDYASDRHTRHKPFMTSRSARSGGFGVRRPLRYLSYHLDLDDVQRRKVAASFETIKLAREQARIDRKKADVKLADELERVDVSVSDIASVLATRSQASADGQAALAKALHEIVAALDDEQREEFAHLLRSGVIRL